MDIDELRLADILFRGKRMSDAPDGNGEWVYGHFHYVNWIDPKTKETAMRRYYILPIGAQDSVRVDPETVGRYICQDDVGKTKIFEGDIVSGGDYNEEDGFGEIVWDKDTSRFGIVGKSNNIFADFDNYYGHELEVVGNIYDTPELLW